MGQKFIAHKCHLNWKCNVRNNTNQLIRVTKLTTGKYKSCHLAINNSSTNSLSKRLWNMSDYIYSKNKCSWIQTKCWCYIFHHCQCKYWISNMLNNICFIPEKYRIPLKTSVDWQVKGQENNFFTSHNEIEREYWNLISCLCSLPQISNILSNEYINQE